MKTNQKITAGEEYDSTKPKDSYKFLLGGIIAILLSILLHVVHIIKTDNTFLLALNEIFAQILSHLGIGLLAIGFLSIYLEMNHWTKYFEERLTKIVSSEKFLKKLSTGSLITLQTEVLKAYFQNEEIGGTEGFLQFYQKNIQAIIGMPFRSNVNLHMSIDEESSEHFLVQEILSYRCMANGNRVQENVCYIPEEGEQAMAIDFHVILARENLEDEIFDLTRLKNEKACIDINKGFNLDIKKFSVNNMNVTVKAKYLVYKTRFIGWRMSHPSRHVTITISFPKNYNINKEYFFSSNTTKSTQEAQGSFYLNVPDWLLPDEGIAFQLMHKQLHTTQISFNEVAHQINMENLG